MEDIDLYSIAIACLLVAILAALVYIAFGKPRPLPITLDEKLDEKIKELVDGIEHHAEVSAVLALLTQFESKPELSANLAGYSQQVVDAALFYQVNTYGDCLKKISEELLSNHKSLANSDRNSSREFYAEKIKELEEQQAKVQQQLDVLNAVIQDRAAIS